MPAIYPDGVARLANPPVHFGDGLDPIAAKENPATLFAFAAPLKAGRSSIHW
jgi:hypothetical protein